MLTGTKLKGHVYVVYVLCITPTDVHLTQLFHLQFRGEHKNLKARFNVNAFTTRNESSYSGQPQLRPSSPASAACMSRGFGPPAIFAIII